MKELSGLTIWLVGASSGIGQALAKKFAQNGNYVIVTARSEDALGKLKNEHPSHIEVISGDITKPDSLSEIERRLEQSSDSIDLVLLCAGTCEYDDGPKVDVAMYRRVFELNFFGAAECIRMALPMLKRAKGTVVGISSLACVVPFPRAEAYGASKAAFEYMLQSLAVDLKRFDVSVTIARPGFVKTPLTQRNDFDMPYLMNPEDAADAIIRGIAAKKRMFAFPWQLSWPINFFSFFKSLWLGSIASQFQKQSQL